MILNIRSNELQHREWERRTRQWHTKFLWFPMRVDDHRVVWLQKVWHKRDYYGGWEYRLENPLEVDNT
jgi:hypothetical protein